jgi:hypothetical protein
MLKVGLGLTNHVGHNIYVIILIILNVTPCPQNPYCFGIQIYYLEFIKFSKPRE